MKITYNKYDDERKCVNVTMVHDGVKHRREVNAVMDGDTINRVATRNRVLEVAKGVEEKIRLGHIK